MCSSDLANVAGTWKLPQGELKLEQKFQMLEGTLTLNGKQVRVAGRMRGDEISFSAGGIQYTGKASGLEMGGTVKNSNAPDGWRATRIGS